MTTRIYTAKLNELNSFRLSQEKKKQELTMKKYRFLRFVPYSGAEEKYENAYYRLLEVEAKINIRARAAYCPRDLPTNIPLNANGGLETSLETA